MIRLFEWKVNGYIDEDCDSEKESIEPIESSSSCCIADEDDQRMLGTRLSGGPIGVADAPLTIDLRLC